MMRASFYKRHCIQLAVIVFWRADTLTVRLLLAWGSLLYAMLMVYCQYFSGVTHEAFIWMGLHWWSWLAPTGPVPLPLFDRPSWALMALVPGGLWTWSAMFVAHWAGVHWRMLDVIEREGWALAVNSLGVFIWAYSTLSITVALGQILPGVALETVVIAFSFWVLIRTGISRELVTA